MNEKEQLQKDAGLAYPPTDLTYELRLAVSGHREDEFLSWGYQWTDKPHRLVFAACCEAEALQHENERLREALEEIADYRKHGWTIGLTDVARAALTTQPAEEKTDD